MTRELLASGSAFMAVCATAGLLAQTPPRQPPTHPPTEPPIKQAPRPPTLPRDITDERKVSAPGCLKDAHDVLGLPPGDAERTGTPEDFVLTSATLIMGTGSGTGRTPEMPESTTSGSPRSGMYTIKGLDDDVLTRHLNQQVEVEGRLSVQPRVWPGGTPESPDRPAAPDAAPGQARRAPLPEIRASTIRIVASACTGGTD